MNYNDKPELSKYKRKNMTQEEIDAYYADIDDEGYKLIESDDVGGYIIELRKSTNNATDQWKVWSDFDDLETYCVTRDEADQHVNYCHDEIQDEIDEDEDY